MKNRDLNRLKVVLAEKKRKMNQMNMSDMNITMQHIKRGDTFVQYQQKLPVAF